MMNSWIMKTFIVLFGICQIFGADVQEPITKQSFKDVQQGLKICGVGARIKQIGPIKAKVYAAGFYVEKDACTKAVQNVKRTNLKEFTDSAELESVIVNGKFDKSIVLKMVRSVGATTMLEDIVSSLYAQYYQNVDALAESVKPRMNGKDESSLDTFKKILVKELDGSGGAKVNTEFCFDSLKSGKLKVSINGSTRGEIHSPTLCNALVGVYVDRKAVSPSLKTDIAKNLFSWK